jgi:hypothetical protein
MEITELVRICERRQNALIVVRIAEHGLADALQPFARRCAGRTRPCFGRISIDLDDLRLDVARNQLARRTLRNDASRYPSPQRDGKAARLRP